MRLLHLALLMASAAAIVVSGGQMAWATLLMCLGLALFLQWHGLSLLAFTALAGLWSVHGPIPRRSAFVLAPQLETTNDSTRSSAADAVCSNELAAPFESPGALRCPSSTGEKSWEFPR